MKWRGMFCDTFFDVEAETKKEALEKMLELLKEQTTTEDFIVWDEGE